MLLGQSAEVVWDCAFVDLLFRVDRPLVVLVLEFGIALRTLDRSTLPFRVIEIEFCRLCIWRSEDNLVLNTDYADTEVPVPDGILSQNARVTLVK